MTATHRALLLLRQLERYTPGLACDAVPMVSDACEWALDPSGRWVRKTAMRGFALRAVLMALRWVVRGGE